MKIKNLRGIERTLVRVISNLSIPLQLMLKLDFCGGKRVSLCRWAKGQQDYIGFFLIQENMFPGMM
jgi:hypothetical protein